MSKKNRTEKMWMAWHPIHKFNPNYWAKQKKYVFFDSPGYMKINGWIAKKVIITMEES